MIFFWPVFLSNIDQRDVEEFKAIMKYKYGKCNVDGCNFPAHREGDQCYLALHVNMDRDTEEFLKGI